MKENGRVKPPQYELVDTLIREAGDIVQRQLISIGKLIEAGEVGDDMTPEENADKLAYATDMYLAPFVLAMHQVATALSFSLKLNEKHSTYTPKYGVTHDSVSEMFTEFSDKLDELGVPHSLTAIAKSEPTREDDGDSEMLSVDQHIINVGNANGVMAPAITMLRGIALTLHEESYE